MIKHVTSTCVLILRWYPDTSFVLAEPAEMIFPKHSIVEWASGNTQTAAKDDLVQNWASKRLEESYDDSVAKARVCQAGSKF